MSFSKQSNRSPLAPAVFLDRDGTVIEQVHHLSRVEDVRVYDFAATALRLFHEQGFRIVVVTNQSAIDRGLLDESGLDEIHAEMSRQLGAAAALIDGIYHCPLKPAIKDPTVVESPDRKPGPGMLQRASRDLGLDLSRSWMVGDAISDILAGRNAGCCGTILVQTGYGDRTYATYSSLLAEVNCCIASDLSSAARHVIDQTLAATTKSS